MRHFRLRSALLPFAFLILSLSTPMGAQPTGADGSRLRSTTDSLCAEGEQLYERGDFAGAQTRLEAALARAGSHGDTTAMLRALSTLHRAHAARADYDRAHEAARRYYELRDTLRSIDEQRQLRELTALYQAEQRQGEIDRLEKDKALKAAELARQGEILRQQQLEAEQRTQEAELLTRETEVHRLERTMSEVRLKAREADAARREKQLLLLEKDRRLAEATLERQTTLRNALIAVALLIAISGFLLLHRMRDRRRAAELQAQLAEAHARTADLETLHVQAEIELREKEAQQRFARGLLEAQEAEHRRLAGELHNTLEQELFAVKTRLMQLHESSGLDGSLDHAIEGIGDTLEDLRRLTGDLRPAQLDAAGLTAALQGLIARADASSHVHFSADIAPVDGVWDMDAEVRLYRIVQEGISNILKHAEAKNATIRLAATDDGYALSIVDDGKGIPEDHADAPRSTPGGLGLRGMAERAGMLGGSLQLESRPGEGCRITVRLPVTGEPGPPPSARSSGEHLGTHA